MGATGTAVAPIGRPVMLRPQAEGVAGVVRVPISVPVGREAIAEPGTGRGDVLHRWAWARRAARHGYGRSRRAFWQGAAKSCRAARHRRRDGPALRRAAASRRHASGTRRPVESGIRAVTACVRGSWLRPGQSRRRGWHWPWVGAVSRRSPGGNRLGRGRRQQRQIQVRIRAAVGSGLRVGRLRHADGLGDRLRHLFLQRHTGGLRGDEALHAVQDVG